MKKSRFSEGQIVGVLKEVDLEAKIGEPSRKNGISDAVVLQVEALALRHDGVAPSTASTAAGLEC